MKHGPAGPSSKVLVPVQTLMQDGLSLTEVQTGLRHLANAGLLYWKDAELVIHIAPAQQKQLTRFYEEE